MEGNVLEHIEQRPTHGRQVDQKGRFVVGHIHFDLTDFGLLEYSVKKEIQQERNLINQFVLHVQNNWL